MAQLTPEQIDHFRARLVAILEEIEVLLGRTRREARPVDLDLPIGRLSRADAIQMQSMAQTNRRQLEDRLKQVEDALAAIEAGTYGTCGRCGDAINPARLEVRPESPLCIDCQEMAELDR